MPRLPVAWRTLCGLVLLATHTALAAGSYPVPLYMPDPQLVLHKKATMTVRIMVRADGSVRFIEVVNAASPALATAMREAVEQWRFEPWTPPGPDAEGEIVKVTYEYRGQGPQRLPLTANVELKKVLCSQLNAEVASNRVRPDNKSAIFDLPVMRSTRRYLSEGHVISTFLPLAERRALTVALLDAGPRIVARCQAEPRERYVDMLPESFKGML